MSAWTKTSRTVELQGRIHSDLFNQEKLILNGVDLTVKRHRHKPEFCLLSADIAPAYKIIIVDAILYVKKVELTPSVFNVINTVLNDKNAQYAITRTRGGQVHVKTVSHVCHRLEIPKPIQSLKKAGNL